MKTKIKNVWLKIRIYIVALLGIIIGATWMFSYAEYKELMSEYNKSIVIINDYFSRKDSAEKVEARLDIEPTELGEFTAYSVGDGFTPGEKMASGKEVYEGAIACPNRFNFGQKIKVDDKIYTCEDRMAERFREGNFFDIYMNNVSEALAFGRQQKEFTIIN
jgi:3D (Asp-Asp-Asp) domain-containing protein